MDTSNHGGRSDPSLKRKHRGPSEDMLPPKKKQHQQDQELDGAGETGQPSTRHRKKGHLRNSNSSKTATSNHPSVNELKRRIRDIKRLLDRVDLPADARVVQERALAGYEKDLADETARRKRSEMIKKYHFVRFLERKSATKELNRLLRKEQEIIQRQSDDNDHVENSTSNEAERALLAKRIHVARVDLNYTIYYPLTEKYVSLFPNKKQKQKKESTHDDDDDDGDCGLSHSDDQAQAQAQSASKSAATLGATQASSDTDTKPEMWHVVEKCMKDGTLQLLRDGKLRIEQDGGKGVIPAGGGGGEKILPSSAATDVVGKKQKQKQTKTKKTEEKREEDKTISVREKDKRRYRTGHSKDDAPSAAAEEEEEEEEEGRTSRRHRHKSRTDTSNKAKHNVSAGDDHDDDLEDSDGGFFEE